MKLSAYLSPSRHGVYYFRWSLPVQTGQTRQSIRISLRTRCPDRAGDLARYLASCGRLLRDNKALARLRQDQIRELVGTFFQDQLKRYQERLDDTGISAPVLAAYREEASMHDQGIRGGDEMSDAYLEDILTPFRTFSQISEQTYSENEASLTLELRKGRRDMLRAALKAAERLEQYSYSASLEIPAAPLKTAPSTFPPLGKAVEDFLSQQTQWTEKTLGQNRAYLNILIEYFGRDRLLSTITKQDANEVKKVLLALPASRNTKPKLKAMSLREAVKEPGHPKIAPKTINSHIQMFKGFFDWAKHHGQAPHTLFEGMKVRVEKRSKTERMPFTAEQLKLIHDELTENTSGYVRSESHKWASLLGLYTGARLNEICQLDVADIKKEDDIWFIDITDEGDNNKRVKADASRRRVPIHSDLIQLGFLDFLNCKAGGKRLFPDYSYNSKWGYSRNLGRWFNESFLRKLDLKTPGVVFHCLRHTMVTRLAQANVPDPQIKWIVGHAQEGVTQQVYNKEGYTLRQLKEGYTLRWTCPAFVPPQVLV